MDITLGGLAFAALIIGQFAAVIAVQRQSQRNGSMVRANPASQTATMRSAADNRVMLIWEGGH